MTNWADGYVADIPYALGFDRETVSAHIAFAALCVGRHPSLSLRPKRVLELGFGMGLGLVINAASNPATQFEGIDFNPLHVAHARGLVEEASLTNVSLREASFQEAAREATEGQHDLDIIVLHGILTWVSADAHQAIVEIARKRLCPGGLLYVSYNCMPGWAPVLPMQRLMREHAKRFPGRSDTQTSTGIELIKALIAEGANYFRVNPALGERVSRIANLDKSYLAHEYLNANWFIFYFADVAEMFDRAKLGFIGSATLAENMDGVSAPEGTRARIVTEGDPIFRETLRDIAGNKQFRRDLFGRGVAATNSAEQNTLLGAMRFTLAIPRSKITHKIPSLMGELEGNAEIYGAVADRLADGPVAFGEIAALPVFKQGGASAALQAVALLVHAGQVLPMPPDTCDATPGQRINRVLVERILQGRVYSFLSAPAAGSGIQASHTDLLIVAAMLAGHEGDINVATQFVIAAMQRLGISWMRDGKAINESNERETVVHAGITAFMHEKLPLWRQLGVL